MPYDPNKKRNFFYVVVTGEPSREEDAGIAGNYLVGIDDDLPAEAAPSAALDIFHEHIGIKMLDDFSISVFDEKGTELVETVDADSYTLGDRGEFHGGVDELPFDLPAAQPNQAP